LVNEISLYYDAGSKKHQMTLTSVQKTEFLEKAKWCNESLAGREAGTLGVWAWLLPSVCLKRPMRICWNKNLNQLERSDIVQNLNVQGNRGTSAGCPLVHQSERTRQLHASSELLTNNWQSYKLLWVLKCDHSKVKWTVLKSAYTLCVHLSSKVKTIVKTNFYLSVGPSYTRKLLVVWQGSVHIFVCLGQIQN
jgi:hypothetical protein